METRIEDFGHVNREVLGSPDFVATNRFHAGATASLPVTVL